MNQGNMFGNNNSFGMNPSGNNNFFSGMNMNMGGMGMNMNNFPRYNIIQVNGRNGAEALQMAPNSKVLLLDETEPLIWFVQTDGAGYKTITPYSITPYQQAAPIDINDLDARLKTLEEKFYAKSYNGANKQRKNRTDEPVETTTTAG